MTLNANAGGHDTALVTRPPADPRKWAAWSRSFPGGHLIVLRAFLGVTFCFAGLQKLSNRDFFQATNPGSIQSQLRASALTTPVGHLMAPAVHIAVVLGLVIAFGEIAVGVGTLLGLYSRVAATGGMLLALSFFLTVSYNTSPYYYGPDIVFVFAWTALALNGAGALSLDAYFVRQRERAAMDAVAGLAEAGGLAGAVGPAAGAAGLAGVAGSTGVIGSAGVLGAPERALVDRRAAMGKIAAASFVGSVVLFFGGVAAAAGRMLAPKTTPTGESFPTIGGTAGATTTTTGASGSPTTTSGTTGTSSGAQPKGKFLKVASAIPVGGAAGFTDPFQGIPAYVVQPRAGAFVAFSAVCTHAGCTVAFVESAEQFQCPCHGSIYSASTGEVIQGPALLPLPSIGLDISGGDLYVTD
jgi:thiosulfate dehydrogenase [quinone] large subunit